MRRPLLLATLLSTAVLAACGGNDDPATEEPATDQTTSEEVSLENCGETVTVAEPPQRIVSLNQGSTEVLLSLGLADRVVGTATWTDPILPSLEEANADIPRLADNAPSLDAVLGQEPELVTASFAAALAEGGVGTREQFADVGVATYVAPSACVGKETTSADGGREEPFEMELVYREIRELAEITGVEEDGEQLVTDLQQKIDDATIDADGTTALFWFANSESPYMAGCCGAPGYIANTLGLTNVFKDETDEWPQISWETVADRNPDVLIIGDLTRKSQTAETGEAKIEFLESNPLTSEMDAVKNKRYILVSGAEMNPSLRTAYGVENVADGLRELGLVD